MFSLTSESEGSILHPYCTWVKRAKKCHPNVQVAFLEVGLSMRGLVPEHHLFVVDYIEAVGERTGIV